MGFCKRCGNISMAAKCRCGGMTVEPLAKGTITSRQGLGDQWQNQYENSILRGHHPPQASVSTPFMQKTPRRTPLLPRNTCEHCNRHVARPFLVDSRFCKTCSLLPKYANNDAKDKDAKDKDAKDSNDDKDKDTQSGNISNTARRSTPCPVTPSESTSLSKLATTSRIVDGNAPLPTRNSTRTASPPPRMGSPNSLSKQPSLMSLSNPTPPPEPHGGSRLLQHYQKSMHAPAAPTPPASPPPSVSPSPTPATSIDQHQPRPTRSLKKETCSKCTEVITGSRVRVPLPNGSSAWFHRGCLSCAKCNDIVKPRKDGQMSLSHDLKHVFHIECDPNWRPLPSVSTPVARKNTASCHRCHQRSEEKNMLRYDKYHYHRECFACYGCHKSLVLDKPFYETNAQVYCQPCEIRNRSRVKVDQSVPLIPTPTNSTPSSIFKNRTAALPKLGGSKRCPCCMQMISVMEDTPGPKASRWHKKCLKCAGCHKQMDSSAKVTEGPKGEWLVHCRGCTDTATITRQPQFVRR